jgi:uncharacterized protein YjeT (DUF2065 family)
MEKLLPRLQIVFAVLFAAAALCGPLVFVQAHLALFAAILTGILLGVATFLIGWLLEVQKRRVVYPFSVWSAGILRLFLSPQQARALKQARGELSPTARRWLGFTSLVIGLLLVVGMVIVAMFILPG